MKLVGTSSKVLTPEFCHLRPTTLSRNLQGPGDCRYDFDAHPLGERTQLDILLINLTYLLVAGPTIKAMIEDLARGIAIPSHSFWSAQS
jgi:hypothetical protein